MIFPICIPCSGKNIWRIYSFQAFGGKVWQMNRSAKGLLIVTAYLDGFSLANRRWFTKLSHYTYGILSQIYSAAPATSPEYLQ